MLIVLAIDMWLAARGSDVSVKTPPLVVNAELNSSGVPMESQLLASAAAPPVAHSADVIVL